MAPKKNKTKTKKKAKKNPEGDGIQATVIRKFEAGELDISVESALNKVPQCTGTGTVGAALRGPWV